MSEFEPNLFHLLLSLPSLAVSETGRTLRKRLGEHSISIENNMPGFPVAEHLTTVITLLMMQKFAASSSATATNNENARRCVLFSR